jgi:tRNA (mo5U34)-methyltransferase
MSLDYLQGLSGKIDFTSLQKIKKERDAWWMRPNAEKWRQALEDLPPVEPILKDFSNDWITLGKEDELNQEAKSLIENSARAFIPWKKGPFKLFHLNIDAEWRSDFKWQRLEKAAGPLKGKRILDIGCNNGYFLFRMAAQNPKLALGIDPVLPFHGQFKLMQHFAQCPQLHFELFGVEHVSFFKESFDTIFFMGIIYHHRHPLQQLIDIREALVPGGEVLIETIGIPGSDSTALFPEDRYARMKNVWFVPTLSCLVNWAKKARFIDVEVVADTSLEEDEQRLTDWCPPPSQSLKDGLDPKNLNLTIEGHPAPRRFLIKARKKGGQ